jgi:hypothetical protein
VRKPVLLVANFVDAARRDLLSRKIETHWHGSPPFSDSAPEQGLLRDGVASRSDAVGVDGLWHILTFALKIESSAKASLKDGKPAPAPETQHGLERVLRAIMISHREGPEYVVEYRAGDHLLVAICTRCGTYIAASPKLRTLRFARATAQTRSITARLAPAHK